MAESLWIQKQVALALYDGLLSMQRENPGLRDERLLDSALARLRQLYAYVRPDLFNLVAAYACGLSQNHPFIDGNKRMAPF
jgi:death-on-curing protein